MTHRSIGDHNNERLEYLGDAILGYVIADILFSQFPDADEGQLSRLRASLVKGEKLAQIANEQQIQELLILGPGELKSGGWRRKSILANTLEAIIGAVYLDSDIATCRGYIQNLYQEHLNSLTLADVKKDAKTMLQEFLQSKQRDKPVYELLSETGKSHCPEFKVACLIKDIDKEFIATGQSKKNAEQAAAQLALDALQLLNS